MDRAGRRSFASTPCDNTCLCRGVLDEEAIYLVVLRLFNQFVAGLAAESFLILPHEKVRLYTQRKISDYDRWLKGMRRLNARFYPLEVR